jgi:hypothetical protein
VPATANRLAPLAGGQLLGLTERQPALLALVATPLIGAAVAVWLLVERGPGQARS